MFSSAGNSGRCIALLISAGVMILGLAKAAAADGIGIDQVAYSYNGSLVAPYSQTGEFEISFTPAGTLQYENVVSNGQWIVQNLPLLPNSVFGANGTAQTYFDLGLIGATSGTNFSGTSVSYFSTTSATPLFSAPVSGTSGSTIVETASALTNSGVPSGLIAEPPPPPGNGINWGALGPYANVQESFHDGLPNVAQEQSWCGPGSAANSLSWLGRTDSQSDLEAQASLAALMDTQHLGTWDDALVSGKLLYLTLHGQTLNVHYTGGTKLPTNGSYTDPVTGLIAHNDGPLTVDWLVQQMKAGQDVELMTPRHWVVLEGIISWGDFAFLEYRDDPYQHGPATTPQELANLGNRHVWSYLFDGMTGINGGVLSAAVAESVPEPSTWAMMLIGFVGLGFAGYLKTIRNAAPASA
jgi:PEP-CTERM motif